MKYIIQFYKKIPYKFILENLNIYILIIHFLFSEEQFKKTPGNLDKYIEFIKDCCKNPHIKKNIKKLEKIIGKTDNISKNLKMTIIEIPNII